MKNISKIFAFTLVICLAMTMAFSAGAEGYKVAEGWEIPVRNDDNLTLNNENSITINTAHGELYTNAENFWLRSVEAGSDFSLTLKVSGAPTVTGHKAGLIIWAGNNYMENVNLLRRLHASSTGSQIALSTCVGTYGWDEPYVEETSADAPVWLKLEKSGTNFKGYYRYSESDEWTAVDAEGVEHADVAAATDLKIGVLAVNGGKTNETATTFTLENFTLDGEVVPFAVEDEGVTLTDTQTSASANVYAKHIAGEKTDKISVNVEWGGMKFDYKTADTTWNPETHKFEATNENVWAVAEGSSNTIKMTNHSSVSVELGLSFEADNTVTGSFSANTVQLDAATETVQDSEIVTFTPAGSTTNTDYQKVGTITVTIQ